MVFWYIISVILIVAGICGTVKAWLDDVDYSLPLLSFFALCFGALLLIGLCGGFEEKNPKPQAIDVYRGKTTLQITYQDTIPTDTVVIWKNEFKPVSKKKK